MKEEEIKNAFQGLEIRHKVPKWRIILHYVIITACWITLLIILYILITNIQILSQDPCVACENLTNCKCMCMAIE